MNTVHVIVKGKEYVEHSGENVQILAEAMHRAIMEYCVAIGNVQTIDISGDSQQPLALDVKLRMSRWQPLNDNGIGDKLKELLDE